MTLNDFLSCRKISNTAFALSVGVHRTTIKRLRTATMTPSYKLLLDIERVTNGDVTPNDFSERVKQSDCALIETPISSIPETPHD